MVKVLPGASREAVSFVSSHWRDLLKMSLIPVALYMLSVAVQLKSMAGLYRSMGSMVHGDKIDPAFFGTYLRTMSATMLFSLLGAIALGWLFVHIIRFQRNGTASWLLLDKAGMKATLMTLLYGLGMVMLTLAAYFCAIIGFVIFALVAAAIMGSGSGSGGEAIVAVMAVMAFVVIVAFLYWFLFRFLVGLPGVALGHSPDFFRDIWPLARGESFGVPLRMLAATLVVYVPITLLAFGFMFPVIREMIDALSDQSAQQSPEQVFSLIADMMDRLLPMTIVITLIFMPFMWFMTLLLGVAFQRFRDKQDRTQGRHQQT
jgi:hypothetical protein